MKKHPLSVFINDTLELDINGVKEEFKVFGASGFGKITSIKLVNTKLPTEIGKFITITIK
jgi:ABC-type proline/glycine betaine transport system ATPase subunit